MLYPLLDTCSHIAYVNTHGNSVAADPQFNISSQDISDLTDQILGPECLQNSLLDTQKSLIKICQLSEKFELYPYLGENQTAATKASYPKCS
jgi:hypothetical protein